MIYEKNYAWSDTVLSQGDIAVDAPVLQIYADMFGVCDTGNREIRGGKGAVSCGEKSFEMSPVLQRQLLRPTCLGNNICIDV